MPSQVAPFPRITVVFDSHEEVMRIVQHLVCLDLRGEIKSPQTRPHRTFLHELGVEVDDTTALPVTYHEIRVAGTLQIPRRGAGIGAFKLGSPVQFLDEGVLNIRADLVDAANRIGLGIGPVETDKNLPYRLIDQSEDFPIDGIVGTHRQDLFSRRGLNEFGERHVTEVSTSVENGGDEGGHGGFLLNDELRRVSAIARNDEGRSGKKGERERHSHAKPPRNLFSASLASSSPAA